MKPLSTMSTMSHALIMTRCQSNTPRSRLQAGSRGAGVVELMVSILIGLVIVLALTRVAVDSDRQQRSSVGSGDVGDAASMASYLLRNSLMSAGHSINFPGAIRCPVTIYREADDSSFAFPNPSPPTPNLDPPGLLPVFIAQGAGTASDTLTVAAGSGRRFLEAGLSSEHNGSQDDFVMDSAFGFMQGDMMLVSQQGQACAIRRIADVRCISPNASGNSRPPCNSPSQPTVVNPARLLVHQSGYIYDPESGSVSTDTTKFNNPNGLIHAGSVVTYSSEAKVTNLGSGSNGAPGLSIHRFSVNGNNFQRTDMMNNTTDTLFGNVMTFQAQYGFRTVTNTIEWCDAPGDASCATFTDDATGWRRVHAVRIAMVIRNPQFENQLRDPSGNCNASPASLTWWDDDGNGTNAPRGSLDLSALTDGRCYRHYVVETTVPLKNMIWNMEQ